MIEALLVVLTNAAAGRDEDFNDWYTNVHTRDAMRYRGSIAQQRFRLSEHQVQEYPSGFGARYLALYEVYDAARFSQEHIDNALTTRMVVEDSIDAGKTNDFHYYPLQFRDSAPRTASAGSVVLEQIAARPGREAAFRDWYNEIHLPSRARLPGVISAAFLAYDPYGQMVGFAPAHDHVGIYRLGDDAARDHWRRDGLLADCPDIDDATLAVTCWDVLTDRVTEDDVLHTNAKALAAEEAARARIESAGSYYRSRGQLLD